MSAVYFALNCRVLSSTRLESEIPNIVSSMFCLLCSNVLSSRQFKIQSFLPELVCTVENISMLSLPTNLDFCVTESDVNFAAETEVTHKERRLCTKEIRILLFVLSQPSCFVINNSVEI